MYNRFGFGLLIAFPRVPICFSEILLHLFKLRVKIILNDITDLALFNLIVIMDEDYACS